ncbi:DUF2232 domain-containing protein [Chroococcus sp. FPU101]|uniref:DUF2232 domain-containing protein n=1 Tax=Chroococcus sp. FPU101 TaxID=1974212 RepID=UPI001A8CA525|nr:DUF2232 domain-containing protein [Chroococcus sp. FPU101]GFE69017.1 hypothetical protein CFPU101_16270 [Chroococcus sp. FPU101]
MHKNSTTATLRTVETAFLASTASLLWLINYYFPIGPLLRIFFPIPIALVYLRWGSRASWMSAIISGLLLSVLMGPTRSIVFLMPYGFMGVQLGMCWKRDASWLFSLFTGGLIDSIGLFFRFWLFSLLLGDDLWRLVITQVTEFAEWVFLKLNIFLQPNFEIIQLLAISLILVQSFVYLLVVHLVAFYLFERLGNPISKPPQLIQIILALHD